jgi:choline dehydrogenase-like flavoprotein
MSCLRQDEPPVPFAQPRVMGGGSSVGGMIALRGLPSDYDEWERRGARGWGWSDVLPVFKAMTCDIDDADQNARGPNIVHRIPQDRWPLYIRRLEQSGRPAPVVISRPRSWRGQTLSQCRTRALYALYLTAGVSSGSWSIATA